MTTTIVTLPTGRTVTHIGDEESTSTLPREMWRRVADEAGLAGVDWAVCVAVDLDGVTVEVEPHLFRVSKRATITRGAMLECGMVTYAGDDIDRVTVDFEMLHDYRRPA